MSFTSEQSENKRQKLDESESSDTEWEDVEDTLTFSINTEPEDRSQLLRRKQQSLQKKRRLTVHRLGMVAYVCHCHLRNSYLSSKVVHKRIKKMLPDSLMEKVKKFKKLRKRSEPSADELLVYILKYLVKWFRLNYKLNCNGLRVLGYLPNTDSESSHYFPNNSPPIASLNDFISVLKKFKHNRDTGAQMFTAILRSLGFRARLVHSIPLLPRKCKLQPPLDFTKLHRAHDNDLLYPYFWTELVHPLDESQVFAIETICFDKEDDRIVRLSRFGAGKKHTQLYVSSPGPFNVMPPMEYAIAMEENGLLIDASPRYVSDINYRYFDRLDLRTESGRSALLMQSIVRSFNRSHRYNDDVNEELLSLRKTALSTYSVPTSLLGIKKSPNMVTKSALRYNEVIDLSADVIGYVSPKGMVREPFYSKNSIIVGKSEQQWKFLGRSIRPDQIETPLKTTSLVFTRSLYRKRLFAFNEINNIPNELNLYSFRQTCPYIREELLDIDGKQILPRNKFGNIEIFRPCMLPAKTTWLKLSNIELILRTFRDQVQFVPVVTGFDFKTKLGTPIPKKDGVIVLQSDEIEAKKLWLRGKLDMAQKQKELRELTSLRYWGLMIKTLRVKERIKRYE